MKKLSISKYIYPHKVLDLIRKNLYEIQSNRRYVSILNELDADNKLKDIGFVRKENDLFVGVNLNPELLLYTDDSRESVELKFIADYTRKHNKFLENEGILDSVKADYERVYDQSDFYGYIVRISYNSKLNRKDLVYGLSYVGVILTSVIFAIAFAI